MKPAPKGVRVRTFGSDSEFSGILRTHPRFQNEHDNETGIALTDCDLIVQSYKHQGMREIACVQIVEVKSRMGEPTWSQAQTYRLINKFSGRKPGVIFYGVSFVRYSGASLRSSSQIMWGRFNAIGNIWWRDTNAEEVLDLVTMLKHPQTMTRRELFKSHHGKTVISMVTRTPLGFETPVVLEKRY